jgi:hypothetical protein
MIQDIRFASRLLLRAKAFASVAILTLAGGLQYRQWSAASSAAISVA